MSEDQKNETMIRPVGGKLEKSLATVTMIDMLTWWFKCYCWFIWNYLISKPTKVLNTKFSWQNIENFLKNLSNTHIHTHWVMKIVFSLTSEHCHQHAFHDLFFISVLDSTLKHKRRENMK